MTTTQERAARLTEDERRQLEPYREILRKNQNGAAWCEFFLAIIDRLTAAPGQTSQIDDSDEDYGEGGGDVRGNLYEAEVRSKTHDPYPHLTALAAATQVTREEIARLACFWFPAPPHATCHDNICIGRCMSAQSPLEDTGGLTPLIKGLTDAIMSLLASRGLVNP